MKNKIVGEIHKLSSGGFDIYITVNFELNTYEIADFNKKKTDSEFIKEASDYAKSLLKNYQDDL